MLVQAGQIVHEQMPDRELKSITYYNGEEKKTIIGKVVAVKDKIYYISDEDQNLVIVSSSSMEIFDSN